MLFTHARAAAQVRGRAWLVQIRLQLRHPGDFLFRGVTYLFVLIVLAAVVGIAWVLFSNSLPTIQTLGLSFLSNEAFDPVHNTFGVRPAIFGTLETSLFALIVALLLG